MESPWPEKDEIGILGHIYKNVFLTISSILGFKVGKKG